MSLTTCIRKAGKNLRDEDKHAILARASALRGEGVKTSEAARQAVDEQIAAVQRLLAEALASPAPTATPVPAPVSSSPAAPAAPAAPAPRQVEAAAPAKPQAQPAPAPVKAKPAAQAAEVAPTPAADKVPGQDDVLLSRAPETDAFKRWFGDSKVVDADGKPLVVYHGTAKSFPRFEQSKTADGLFWFTSDREALERGEVGAAASGAIMPVYLSAKKLAGWDDYEAKTTDQLIAEGFDGVKLDNDYIVFSPTQIKSATGNRGTFDPQNARIDLRRGTGTGMDPSIVRGIIDALKADGTITADVNVAATVADMPAAQRDAILAKAPDGNARGAYFRSNDQVWLVAENLRGPDDAVFVLLHEAFHRGLHVTLGEQGAQLLRQIYATNAKVRTLADANMKQFGIGKEEATNEALADIAGQGEVQKLNGWGKLVRMVREWLRKVAAAAGIELGYTDKEIAQLVASMRKAGLEGGVSVSVASAGALASRGNMQGMPDDANAPGQNADGSGADSKRTAWETGPSVPLFRAANDTDVRAGTSFGERRSTAEAYTDNPGFGGGTVYEVKVPRGRVLDIADAENPWRTLSKAAGIDLDKSEFDGYIARVLPTNDAVIEALAAKGYDWVRLTDDFPAGAVTWMVVSERAMWAASDAMDGLNEQSAPIDGGAAQPGTSTFDRWFGDSKIVDAEGKPRVMYHGTGQDFDAFRPKQAGAIFLTDEPIFAQAYADTSAKWMAARGQDGAANIMPVYVKAENPFDFENAEHVDAVMAKYKPAANPTGWESTESGGPISRNALQAGDWNLIENADVQRAIKAAGFDGFYVDEGGFKNLGVYQPTQIKSATGNRGAFDPNEESVLLSRYTPEQREALQRAGIAPRRRLGDHLRRAWSAAAGLIADRSEIAQGFRQGALDQFFGIQRAVQRDIGNLPVEQDPYITARLANGGTSSVMRALLLHGQAQWAANGQHLEKKPGTEGLLDILQPLGDDLNNWFGWMIGNRAARLKAEGRENNFTDAQIKALQSLDTGKTKEFRAAAIKYAAFKRSVLDVAEQAGLINPETRPAWDNADYIPFYRQIDERASFSPTGRKGLAGQSSGIRTLRGGEAALNDPIENLLMNFSRLIDASLKNNAIDNTVQVLEQGGSHAIEQVGYTMTSAIVPRAQLERQLLDAGTPPQVLAVIPQEAFDGMAKLWAIQAPTDLSVIRVMREGRPVFYKVHDPLLLKAATSFVPFDFPGLGVMRMFKRILTATVTATPEFMARNFIRDSLAVQGIARTGVNPAKSLAGIVKAFRENGAAEHMLFAGASFQSGNMNAADPTGTATAVRRALRQKGMDATSADRFISTIVDKPVRLWELYRHIGEAVENANREAMFEATQKAGGSVTAAAFEAKDLMDFSLRGSHPLYQLAADVLPFFNARVQGLYRLGRSDPKRVAIYAGIMATLSVALVMANSGQDWFDELPDWDKDTYWHFKIRGVHFRIPKPFELGVAFATIPERIARYIAGQDTAGKMGLRVWANVRDQLAFDPIPQALRPAANVWANKDTFRDSPIENQGDAGKLPHLRYGPRTSPTAKTVLAAVPSVAEKLELSPKKLEYLVGGYLGTAGQYALGLSDMAVRALEGYPPQPAPRVDDLPVVKAFVRADPARSTVFETDLYKIREQVDHVYKSVKALEKEDRADDAKALADKHQKEMAAHTTVDQAGKSLATIRKARDAIYRDRTMTPAVKRAELDKLQVQENAIAKQAMREPVVKALQ